MGSREVSKNIHFMTEDNEPLAHNDRHCIQRLRKLLNIKSAVELW